MKTTHLLALLCLCGACASEHESTHAPATAPVARPTAQPVAEPAAAPVAQPAIAAQDDSGVPLYFAAQDGWLEEAPASRMRAAQYRLPGEAGEATLIVYHFGQGGGSIEDNLARWAGQFEQPDGGDSAERMTKRERRVGELEALVVDLAGTYVAETSPGSGEHLREEHWRMLVAVVEAPQGRYYAKLVGPEATVAANAERFEAFLDALR